MGIQLLKKQAVSTFLLIEFAWIFFRADSIADALGIIRHMVVWNPWILSDGTLYTYGLDYKDFRMAFIGIALSGVVDFFWIVIFGVYGATFDSSSFIYFQF